jgi:hypothetical protein
MPWMRTPPTHRCDKCSKSLWWDRWPYALCKTCGQEPCPHGNKIGECNTCDMESDRAYDAAKSR